MQPKPPGEFGHRPQEDLPQPILPLDGTAVSATRSTSDMPRAIPRQESAAGPVLEEHDLDRLWQYFTHDDNQFAQRVAFFLVAESIFLATAASLVNAVAGMTSLSRSELRAEVFAFSLIIILAGLSLSVIFWYIFRLNFDDIGASLDLISGSDSVYALVRRRQAERRRRHRHLPALFRRRGKNWVTVNCLGLGFIAIWVCTAVFAILVFASHQT